MVEDLSVILADHAAGEKFRVREIDVSAERAAAWVQVKGNPVRFVPEVFSGDWAIPDRHPSPGVYRVLSVVECDDELARAVIRDGRHLYATPFV